MQRVLEHDQMRLEVVAVHAIVEMAVAARYFEINLQSFDSLEEVSEEKQ